MSMNPHERPEPMLRHFSYHALPAKDRPLPKAISDIAHAIVDALPPSAERTVALRKLLEGQDALIRALTPEA